MTNWKGIVGASFTTDKFDSYCQTLHWTAWRPSFIVLHNTAIPTLAQRPNGITQQHIQNFVSFYRDVQGWDSGPHLFVDDRQIWVFTPLTVPGTHSPSWNNVSLGLEMLGDYAQEAFDSGRGLLVRHNAEAALASLSTVLGLDPLTMRLHREDPLTTHACPGANVHKLEVIQEVQNLILARHPGEHAIPPAAGSGAAPAATPPTDGADVTDQAGVGAPVAGGTPASPATPPASPTLAASGTPDPAAAPAAAGAPAASPATPAATSAPAAPGAPDPSAAPAAAGAPAASGAPVPGPAPAAVDPTPGP